jgi:ABC-type molybdenum transport system ATPase subunit/photorepair protein PhrA
LVEWAELLRLGHLLDKPFAELSQGQQKLAIIARALLGAPPLIIMDECCQVSHVLISSSATVRWPKNRSSRQPPPQGLDAEHRALVLEVLDRVARAASWASLIQVTHHDDEVLPACDHVLEIVKGRVTYCGARERFLGGVPRLD